MADKSIRPDPHVVVMLLVGDFTQWGRINPERVKAARDAARVLQEENAKLDAIEFPDPTKPAAPVA